MKIGDVSISTLIFVYTHKYIRSTIVCETEYLTKKLILKVSKYIYIYIYELSFVRVRDSLFKRREKRKKEKKKCSYDTSLFF